MRRSERTLPRVLNVTTPAAHVSTPCHPRGPEMPQNPGLSNNIKATQLRFVGNRTCLTPDTPNDRLCPLPDISFLNGGTLDNQIACPGDRGFTRMSHLSAQRSVVLVVEDDFFIRMNATQMIEAAGFNVVEAANSDEAIAILEVRLDITVVFTDIQMPGWMDGLKLAAAIRGRWPPIHIVATSGFVGVRKDDLPNGGRFLPKPYSPAQIIGALREFSDSARTVQ
jgi:CheY-like chemotaxis protein